MFVPKLACLFPTIPMNCKFLMKQKQGCHLQTKRHVKCIQFDLFKLHEQWLHPSDKSCFLALKPSQKKHQTTDI